MFSEHYQLSICDSQKDNSLAIDELRREEIVPVYYVSKNKHEKRHDHAE